jgi:hypothetical protein
MSDHETAQAFVNKSKEYGFSYSANGCVLSVCKKFTPGDKAAYCAAESDANILLSMVKRTTAGSTWGTDGGSIGGHVGLTGGYMTLNKSGCSNRILAQIAKIR